MKPVQRVMTVSPNEMGMIGLNTIPTARMDKAGTVRIGVGTSDPYMHSFLGFQLTDYLTMNLRQTAEVSSLNENPRFLYPGLDLKLRLMTEGAYRPALVVGVDSAFGHKRLSSEYVVLSKRYGAFDFTGGLAWGRLGSKGLVSNPMKIFGSGFDGDRDFNDITNNNIQDWFQADEIGLFAGVEYATPLKGLTLKAEYGANDYVGERAQTLFNNPTFDAPAPWSVGVNYQPWSFVNLAGGIIGGDKIMGRVSFQGNAANWIGRPGPKKESAPLRSPRPTNRKRKKGPTRMNVSAHQPLAHQIGRQARLHADKMQPQQENIHLKLHHKGLKGPELTLIRSDLERAVIEGQSSADEIWHDTTIKPNQDGVFSVKRGRKKHHDFRLIWDNQLSLSQFDANPLYRTSLIIHKDFDLKYGFHLGTDVRLNIDNNLELLSAYNIPALETIRSDVEDFANQRYGVDRLYGAWLHSLSSDVHVAAQAGYLEEMFAGYGGEILYRPFGKNYAVGAEFFRAAKRDVGSNANRKFTGQHRNTGFLNLFYEVPNTDMTFYAKAGQYLQEDYGVTGGLKKRFENGVTLEGFLTQTNKSDFNVFGNVASLYGGVRLSLPIGNVPLLPEGSEIRFSTLPFGRGAGQTLDRPLELYEITEPVSYRRLTQTWPTLLD